MQRVQNLETTNRTSSTISFQWTSLASEPNLLRYEGYKDDVLQLTIGSNLTTAVLSNLDSDTTYKISVRAIYDIDGEEAGAFDTDLFETTL